MESLDLHSDASGEERSGSGSIVGQRSLSIPKMADAFRRTSIAKKAAARGRKDRASGEEHAAVEAAVQSLTAEKEALDKQVYELKVENFELKMKMDAWETEASRATKQLAEREEQLSRQLEESQKHLASALKLTPTRKKAPGKGEKGDDPGAQSALTIGIPEDEAEGMLSPKATPKHWKNVASRVNASSPTRMKRSGTKPKAALGQEDDAAGQEGAADGKKGPAMAHLNLSAGANEGSRRGPNWPASDGSPC